MDQLWDGFHLSEMLAQTRSLDNEKLLDHDVLTSRLKRTLYYDPLKRPDMDTLSFSATKSAVSCFRHAAPMPIGKLGHRYASRVVRDACISPCALLLGLIYIERLKHKNPNYLDTISSSELFLISMMVASKYLYDEGCEDEVFNDEWAISGDMDVEKVNKLERDFLGAIDWHLYVHRHEFSSMLNIAETDIALSNGCERGWLTYSDLRSLLNCHSIYNQLTQTAGILSKATCICMLMYSGLVCLAAFTSAALVTVSQLARPGEMQMGPHPQKHHINTYGECNDTDEEYVATNLVEPVEELLNAESFPGFPSHSNIIKQVLRNRLGNSQGHLFRGRPPSNNQVTLPMPVNEVKTYTTTTLFTDVSITSYSNTKSNLDIDPHRKVDSVSINKVQKSSICTMLEAVIFMAHVPTVCKDPAKTVCSNCGRQINHGRSELPVCMRFENTNLTTSSNCSINFKLIDDMLQPSYTHYRHQEKYSSRESYHHTIPPSPNITSYRMKRNLIVVH